MLHWLNESFRRLPRGVILGASLAVTGLVALLDYRAGPEIGMTVFYLPPIAAATWYLGRSVGVVVAFLSTAIATVVAWITQPSTLSGQRLLLWNSAVQLLFFLLAVTVASIMAGQTLRLRTLAREDALTGIPNRRAFFGALARAVEWGRRHGTPWVLGYVDVDDFKRINDTLGHGVGDAVLRTVARTMHDGIRRVDVVARLGGDEFALLLPETDADRAEVVVNKLLVSLRQAMAREGWEVTFSIGVITFLKAPHSVDAAVAATDECMYGVKARGKAAAAYQTWPDRYRLVPAQLELRISGRKEA